MPLEIVEAVANMTEKKALRTVDGLPARVGDSDRMLDLSAQIMRIAEERYPQGILVPSELIVHAGTPLGLRTFVP